MQNSNNNILALQVHWDQVTPDSYGYLQIQNGYSMIENDSVYEERMKFWDKAIEEYGKEQKINETKVYIIKSCGKLII